MHSRTTLLAIGLVTGAACFPTFQAARVEPGFRIDAAVTVLGDQPRHDTPQGTDIMGFVTPAYGFGRLLEIGVPFGVYAENGLFNSGPLNGDQNSLLVMPYLKLALLPTSWPHHLSVTAQSSYILPANVGLRYGRDLGAWEPQVGFNYIFSGGTAGDDPTITRYQEKDQTMLAFSAGATWNRPHRVAIEIGVLRNRFSEVIGWRGSQELLEWTTRYDLYVGMRVSVLK